MASQDRYDCPICGVTQEVIPRYPRYVSAGCESRAVSPSGRALVFFNVSLSGGYLAKYRDTGESYDSHDCCIEGIACYADEARFGGVVIEVKE